MKKTVLFITTSLLLFFNTTKAQTTTWDFTANNPTWTSSGIGTGTKTAPTEPGKYIDSKGLGLFGIIDNSNFAGWNTQSASTWKSPADAYSGTVRVQTNGGGYAGGANEAVPTQRYFYIQVDKACTVEVWFKSGSGGIIRNMIASDGTTVYGKSSNYTTATTPTATDAGMPTDGGILKANITKAGTFYLYGDAAVNIYQIQVAGANVSTTPTNTLATSDFSQKLSAKAYSTGNKVYLTNLSGKSTEVKVYSSTGALVKSLKTSTDTNFELNTKGLYFVNLKSEAGEKSVKVLIK
ncbi:T9SS type A sorting domain-containing protein [Cloacibacterium sp.]|uniref:T9SS type A sorting domain-containing protein n=1 Tax=Cloacibacterium sp. TaxID=1913682 RepID=UPI0039E53BA2